MVLLPQRHAYIETMPGRVPQRAFSFFRPADIEDAYPVWQKLFEIPADYQKMDVGGMMTHPAPPNQ